MASDTLRAAQLILGWTLAAVWGIIAAYEGLLEIRAEGTRDDEQGWLSSRVFLAVNGIRFLLGMPPKERLSRAELRTLGVVKVTLGMACLVFLAAKVPEVIRLALILTG